MIAAEVGTPIYKAKANATRRTLIKARVMPLAKPVMLPGYDPRLIKRIGALPGLSFKPNDLSGVELPELRWVAPGDCCVDFNYQREPNSSDYTLLMEIVSNFSWEKFGTPNGVIGPDGSIFVTDGQKRAYACYHHPDIELMPILLVKAKAEQLVKLSAGAFVALNEAHTPVPRADRFTAKLMEGDPVAIKVAAIFKAYNIKPIRKKIDVSKCAAGDTMIIQKFQSILQQKGEDYFKRLCWILAQAKLSPIQSIHVGAVSRLLSRETSKSRWNDERLIDAIRSKADNLAISDATVNSRKFGIGKPLALAGIYETAYKKSAKPL